MKIVAQVIGEFSGRQIKIVVHLLFVFLLLLLVVPRNIPTTRAREIFNKRFRIHESLVE